MKSQFNSILEGNMKLELIQIDCYGASFGLFITFFLLANPSRKQEISSGQEITKISERYVRQKPYHMLSVMQIRR